MPLLLIWRKYVGVHEGSFPYPGSKTISESFRFQQRLVTNSMNLGQNESVAFNKQNGKNPWVLTIYTVFIYGDRITYIERNIRMSAIDRPNCEACIPGHCSVNCTLSKKRAVDIVRSIAWNCPDHVCRICKINWLYTQVEWKIHLILKKT